MDMDCGEDCGNGGGGRPPRVSPLRGNLSHEDIVSQTRTVRNGLGALRDDHYNILARIRDECDGNNNDDGKEAAKDNDNQLLEERIQHVTASLEQLEVGIEESSVILQLSDHFQRLEADRSTLRLEMGRVQDENDWLREELSDTQRKLQEALAEVAELREEKRKWEFEEELRNAATETNVRPITPSKIPVGSWRVEEERDINRALNGDKHSRNASPAPAAPSRIPMGSWRSKASAYKNVMEKEKLKAAAKSSGIGNGGPSVNGGNGSNGKRQYFKLNASSSASAAKSKIPSR